MSPIQQHILELRKQLNEHNYNYYVLNRPTISDRDFDFLMKELEQLEQLYPEFDDPMSPTHRVGSDINKSFAQVEHIHPMLSLGNSYSVAEVEDFIRKAKAGLTGQTMEIVGELKFDGTSISLIYEHGRLVRAVTRGDGVRGDDVTANVKTIRSIPLQLTGSDYPDAFEIRGEVLLPWKAFNRLNEQREKDGEALFANPRNAAAGTLKLQNSAEVARRGLDAYLYHIIGDNLPSDTHWGNLQAARSWGFKISNDIRILNSIEEVDDFINYWDEQRKQLPVATDGLVFKVNNLNQQLNLGFTSKFPRWAIAFKFKAEQALTRLVSVSFQVGRTGVVTPVANLDTVPLSGTMVSRATLHNEDFVRSLDLHLGDMVYVEKGGEIIPKITGVELERRTPESVPVSFVTHCPECGAELVRDEGEAAWVCPNKSGCEPQLIGKIEHFAGRKMMNIDSIGGETAQLLFKSGLVRNIADLYSLTREQILSLDRFAERSAQRLLQGIEQSKNVPFERVVFALSIPFVGETVAKKIARAAGDIDRLMGMTIDDLTSIDDIGPRIAESVVGFFADEENRRIVERLKSAGLQMAIERKAASSEILAGKSIIISGTFDYHSRDEYKAIIEQNGGKNVSSISKNTDYVLAGHNMGPAKLEKATSLGITILSEEDFLSLIGSAPSSAGEQAEQSASAGKSEDAENPIMPDLFSMLD